VEQSRLINFLDTGKGLYIEGTDFGYDNHSTALYQRFGCSYDGDGYPYTTGNVQYVDGQSGSFAAGLSYDYMYQQLVDNYVDFLGSTGGTLFFRSQDSQARAVNYSGPANAQRAVHSAVVFGALRNGPDTKLNLMDIYMNYLTEILGKQEMTNEYIGNITVTPNPAAKNVAIKLAVTQPARVKVMVYNTAGQKVRDLVDQTITKGEQDITWDRRDNTGRELNSGTYIIAINTPLQKFSKTIVLVK
jgi:hypothetical protein